MSKADQSDEKFPLLLLFLEDGQRSSKQNRRIAIDKGRYHGISSGANTIIMQWPGHIASCWITATLVGISIVIVTMLMLAFSMRPGIINLTAQCKRQQIFHTNDSATIHLVHSPAAWDKKQLDILELIVKNYPQSQIELIMIRNPLDLLPKLTEIHYMYSTENASASSADKTIKKRSVNELTLNTTVSQKTTTVTTAGSTLKYDDLANKNLVFDTKIGLKRLFDILSTKTQENLKGVKNKAAKKKTPKTIVSILQAYPNIKVVNSTYEKIFKSSPLHYTWHNTNEETRLFAVRVLQLWNYGGIGFSLNDISEPLSEPAKKNATLPAKTPEPVDSDIRHMITVGISNFKNLPFGLVTVDDGGFHMETKTPCHAFLGELLIELKKANRSTKAADVIKKTLHRFCLKKAVDAHYCKTYDD